MDLFNQIGKMAVGSRLRRLTDKITEDAAQIYRLYDVDIQPKWFPVYYVLSRGEAKTITAIAAEIGHSHPSVSKIVREMVRKGYIKEKKDKGDGRKNVVQLTPLGMKITEKIKDQYDDVNDAVEELSGQAQHDLWRAIEEWEFLLGQKSLMRRVLEKKKNRERKDIVIVDFEPQYREAFKRLNEEWIEKFFKMESADHKALDNPEDILAKGGYIVVALYNGEPAGVCALIKMNDPEYDFELAKMAVSPKAQGKGVGRLLGNACIERARVSGARKLYLESNTILKPAIQLYHSLGFQKTVSRPSPYERSNIQMELVL